MTGHVRARTATPPARATARILLAATLLATTATIVPGLPADAAHPGENGAIAFERGSDIWIANPDGSGQINVTNTADVSEDRPEISPDGLWVAFESAQTNPEVEPSIHVMKLDGTGRRAVAIPGGALYEARNPTWSPDGVYLAFDGYHSTDGRQTLWAAPFDGDGTQGMQLTSGITAQDPSWGVTGEIAFTHGDGGIWALDPYVADPEPWEVASGSPYNFRDPDWSPDGSQLVFGCDVNDNICAVAADGSNLRRLTYPGLSNGGSAPSRTSNDPHFSPDGTMIIFSGDDPHGDAGIHLHTIPASGFTPDNGGSTQVTSGGGEERSPSWGPAPGTGIDPIGGGGGGGGGGGEVPANAGRLAGETRYDTAVAIARVQFPDGAVTVYIARADNVVDAVAGGVLTDGPVLLVPQCGPVPTTVLQAVDDMGPRDVVALGGESAICDQVLQDAADMAGARRLRHAGQSRFDTAAKIAVAQFPEGAETTYLARADNVVDAVAGGVLTTGPVLLVPQCGDLPAVVVDALQAMGSSRVVALGGPGAICSATLEAAADVTGAGAARHAGDTRFDTAVQIGTAQFPRGASLVFLARADNVVDAVAGGVLTTGPILLVPQCGDIPATVLEAIGFFGPTKVIALGGSGAICNQVLADAADAA